MKILAAIALLSSLLFQQPCALVDLTLGQASVQRGASQSISTQVTNCGTKKTMLRLTVTVTDAVGTISVIRNTSQNYNAGQVVVFPDSYAVAANAPLGTYRVMSIVFHTAGGSTTEIARDEQTFEVVP